MRFQSDKALEIQKIIATCLCDRASLRKARKTHQWKRALTSYKMDNYSLSHNYCKHHFFGLFQILLYLWSFLFHCEIHMPYGVARSKIILIRSLFSQILILNFSIHSLYKVLPCNLIVSNNGTQVYVLNLYIYSNSNSN